MEKKHFVKIVTIMATVFFKNDIMFMYLLCIYKKTHYFKAT